MFDELGKTQCFLEPSLSKVCQEFKLARGYGRKGLGD